MRRTVSVQPVRGPACCGRCCTCATPPAVEAALPASLPPSGSGLKILVSAVQFRPRSTFPISAACLRAPRRERWYFARARRNDSRRRIRQLASLVMISCGGPGWSPRRPVLLGTFLRHDLSFDGTARGTIGQGHRADPCNAPSSCSWKLGSSSTPVGNLSRSIHREVRQPHGLGAHEFRNGEEPRPSIPSNHYQPIIWPGVRGLPHPGSSGRAAHLVACSAPRFRCNGCAKGTVGVSALLAASPFNDGETRVSRRMSI
jgi:hypothetical protein